MSVQAETTEQLRALVHEVLRDALPTLLAARRSTPVPPAAPGQAPLDAVTPMAPLAPPDSTAVSGRAPDGVEFVRIDSDRDLSSFVHRLLRQFENPGFRSDIRSGKRRFALVQNAARGAAGGAPRRRIDKGAVTEAQVKDAARAGAALVLGPRAVLTPLARDKARSLGVTIEKERPC